MEELLEILSDLHPEVDFTDCDTLIDDKILDSFDIITLITEILHAGRIAGLVADIGFLGAAIWYSKKVTDAIREYYY